MANLANDNKEAQKQVLAAIKAGMEMLVGIGIVHDRDRQAKTLEEYKTKILKYFDTVRNKTVMRGAFISFQGPAPTDSGTVNRTPPEISYKILIVWQFEDTDSYNSTSDFNDMMMDFYDYFEQNHSLGYSGLNIYTPELISKAQVVPFDNFYCHMVEFELTCTLYGT